MTQEEYLQLCGKLIWIASQTRPDIAYAVHQRVGFFEMLDLLTKKISVGS